MKTFLLLLLILSLLACNDETTVASDHNELSSSSSMINTSVQHGLISSAQSISSDFIDLVSSSFNSESSGVTISTESGTKEHYISYSTNDNNSSSEDGYAKGGITGKYDHLFAHTAKYPDPEKTLCEQLPGYFNSNIRLGGVAAFGVSNNGTMYLLDSNKLDYGPKWNLFRGDKYLRNQIISGYDHGDGEYEIEFENVIDKFGNLNESNIVVHFENNKVDSIIPCPANNSDECESLDIIEWNDMEYEVKNYLSMSRIRHVGKTIENEYLIVLEGVYQSSEDQSITFFGKPGELVIAAHWESELGGGFEAFRIGDFRYEMKKEDVYDDQWYLKEYSLKKINIKDYLDNVKPLESTTQNLYNVEITDELLGSLGFDCSENITRRERTGSVIPYI
ncbi:MAG: hypothetical protein OCC49_18360 [Fibrobacterales bacterium]